MSGGAMFRRVSGMRTGYHPEEVDDFFTHARTVYEQGPAGALSSRDVRTVAFDLVRNGYSTTAVDAALDRLEAAFVARSRADFIAERGRQAWMETLAEQARSLYGRLTRPDGERFAHPKGRLAGYDAAEVDALCGRLVAYFDSNAPLTAQEVRSAVFARRKGAKAYAEAPVDAFLERAVDVLLAAE
ncbi:DivIVA domain-containing protein [Cellulomonas pakistanensis]|uniref:DivIVA domain-containing protein n=1 Tax=Cellulomonas pakistanensis TaxID=992287 RepID=A0A919PBA6_9CELL|nr:DivIVA domain-containing protein [Cellulomonas pakistanensis]GIG37845.1 DivIVA domain-containing protein [Cellulomonas pakistanensis]